MYGKMQGFGFFLKIYLASPDVNSGMEDLVFDQGLKLKTFLWEYSVLTTGLPVKSQHIISLVVPFWTSDNISASC